MDDAQLWRFTAALWKQVALLTTDPDADLDEWSMRARAMLSYIQQETGDTSACSADSLMSFNQAFNAAYNQVTGVDLDLSTERYGYAGTA